MSLGLSVGYGKPDFNVFFEPIVKELKKLEYGVTIEDQNHLKKEIKFLLLASIFDKSAKASVLNVIASHGFEGCLKCLSWKDY